MGVTVSPDRSSAPCPSPEPGSDPERPSKVRFLDRRLQPVVDAIGLTFALAAAYLLRWEFSPDVEIVRQFVVVLPLVLLVEGVALYVAGVYSLIWRYFGMLDFRRVVKAVGFSMVPLLCLRLFAPGLLLPFRVPLSIILINGVLAMAAVAGVRLAWRILVEERRRGEDVKRGAAPKARKPALFVGAGRDGVLAIRDLAARGNIEIDVKGFVDDDPGKAGTVVHGIPVLGTTADIPRLVREYDIEQVVITISQGNRAGILKVVGACEKAGVKARIIPGLFDILQGRVGVKSIREVQIEDLLGREPVRLGKGAVRGMLAGRTVMVTGAGGSIGSELCRQALRFSPARILLVERSEPALYEIDRELRARHQDLPVVPLIADVADRARMQQVFSQWTPDVVIHAAAHKHVPMMELNVGEAIHNNVSGTRVTAELAADHGVATFVLVSTDKAVNPTSVMGTTKRLAELVVQALEGRSKTRFVAVRFGNVLGSAGSVIPLFREQIARGGPVTVTHPDMKRYFMTIPEASQLVLEAGALAEGGEVFVLDMGEPVKVLSLAEDMIRLSGLRPYEDVDIHFTGVRPGEKLFEELGTSAEQVRQTAHPKIFVGRIVKPHATFLPTEVDRLTSLARKATEAELRNELMKAVPEATLRLPEHPPSSDSGAARLRPETVRKGPGQAAPAATPRAPRKDPLPLN